ncbi:MAG: hypothetical protein AB6733_07715 [Clostridiaceae bacterium]
MVQIFILILLFFVPGFIGVRVYEYFSRCQMKDHYRRLALGMIYNFLALIIMLIGLWIFKQIYYVKDLVFHFTSLHFTMIYAFVSVLENIGLGLLWALLRRLFCPRR